VLEALPVTQSDKSCPILLPYYQATSEEIPKDPKETKLSLLGYYIQLIPSSIKDIADFIA
jgi:hypothetical protein